jgi:branched-chain amino acid transport system permease protein
MSAALFIEQLLNGLQLGMTLFLMAAGLTLVFGVMGLINLAHGSLYMVGAFACAAVAALTGSFWLGLGASLAAAAIFGALIEMVVIRRLYARDHLDQVLATFALILVFSEGTRWLFGSFPLYLTIPPALTGAVTLPGGIDYPLYRLAIIVIGVAVAAGLMLLISKTRLGIRIRAGEADREMIAALGVNISTLYTIVFALGAALAGLAGALVGALGSVQVGMGEPVLISRLRRHRHRRHRVDQGRPDRRPDHRGHRHDGPRPASALLRVHPAPERGKCPRRLAGFGPHLSRHGGRAGLPPQGPLRHPCVRWTGKRSSILRWRSVFWPCR